MDTLIIMHGGPATGKTTLGRRLAETLGFPYFSKDGVKEPMFDHVGVPLAWETDDVPSGQGMDDAAQTILFYIIKAHLAAHRSCVIDSTFRATHATRFEDLQIRYPHLLVQILCRTEASELRKRWQSRADTGERHPGHNDRDLAKRLALVDIDKVYRHLDIGGLLLTVDTTSQIQESRYTQLVESINNYI